LPWSAWRRFPRPRRPDEEFDKIGLILIAGVTLLCPTMGDRAGESTPEDRAPLTGKIIAAWSICLWIGVIFSGAFCPISKANSSMLVP
jgi:hypothetical protein